MIVFLVALLADLLIDLYVCISQSTASVLKAKHNYSNYKYKSDSLFIEHFEGGGGVQVNEPGRNKSGKHGEAGKAIF